MVKTIWTQIYKKKQKMISKKLMNNGVFKKTMENVRKHRDIKLGTTEKGRNYLVSEPKYIMQEFFFFWKSINTNEKKKQIPMNKLVLLGFLIL